MPKKNATAGDAPEMPDYSELSDTDQQNLISLTDGIAEAALSGVLASAQSIEAQAAAAATVWFKIVPEYFAARDAYYAAVFGVSIGDDGTGDAPE